MVLWQQISVRIEDSTIAKDFAKRSGKGWRKAFEAIQADRTNDSLSDKDYVIMDPHRCASLLKSGDPLDIQKHFHLLDDLITLRRSSASTLKINEDGATYSLRNMMKQHRIETLMLERSGPEELAYQWFHRDAAE